MSGIKNFPSHNPFLRTIYLLLIVTMLSFFAWLLFDPNALSYVSYHQSPIVDFISCQNGGGEVHGDDCYISETVKFPREAN